MDYRDPYQNFKMELLQALSRHDDTWGPTNQKFITEILKDKNLRYRGVIVVLDLYARFTKGRDPKAVRVLQKILEGLGVDRIKVEQLDNSCAEQVSKLRQKCGRKPPYGLINEIKESFAQRVKDYIDSALKRTVSAPSPSTSKRA